MTTTLAPQLAALADRYGLLVRDMQTGTVAPHDAQARFRGLHATDADGVVWQIAPDATPERIQFLASGPAGTGPAEPERWAHTPTAAPIVRPGIRLPPPGPDPQTVGMPTAPPFTAAEPMPATPMPMPMPLPGVASEYPTPTPSTVPTRTSTALPPAGPAPSPMPAPPNAARALSSNPTGPGEALVRADAEARRGFDLRRLLSVEGAVALGAVVVAGAVFGFVTSGGDDQDGGGAAEPAAAAAPDMPAQPEPAEAGPSVAARAERIDVEVRRDAAAFAAEGLADVDHRDLVWSLRAGGVDIDPLTGGAVDRTVVSVDGRSYYDLPSGPFALYLVDGQSVSGVEVSDGATSACLVLSDDPTVAGVVTAGSCQGAVGGTRAPA